MPRIIGTVYWVRDEYIPTKGPFCEESRVKSEELRISCAMQSEILSSSLYEKDRLPNFRAVFSEFCFTIS
jgi:hypothetical protein